MILFTPEFEGVPPNPDCMPESPDGPPTPEGLPYCEFTEVIGLSMEAEKGEPEH